MEQKLRFGLDLDRLALLKKKFGPIISSFWGQFFHIFNLIFFESIVAYALKSCIKWCWKKKSQKINKWILNIEAKKHFQLCLALLEIPHPATYLCIMTLYKIWGKNINFMQNRTLFIHFKPHETSYV